MFKKVIICFIMFNGVKRTCFDGVVVLNKCPKCGAALPEEAHFCMHCFYSKDFVEEKKISSKGGFALRALFASKAFKAVLFSLLAVSLLAVGAVTLKSLIRPVKKVSSEDVSFIPVTAENGETVTDKNGEAVTQKVIRVTDESGENVTNESGEQVYREVVPVTKANGEAVTDKSGEQVYEIVTSNEEETLGKTTSRKNIFDFLFNNKKEDKKETQTTQGGASPSEPVATTLQNIPTSVDGSTTSDIAATDGSTKPYQPENSTTKDTVTSFSESTYPASSTTTTTDKSETTVKTNVNDFSYTTFLTNAIRITKYNGSDEIVYVPAYIDGKEVCRIDENAFANNAKIKKIIFESRDSYVVDDFMFPNSKTVFYNLPNLTTIVFPKRTLATVESGNTNVNSNLYQKCEKLKNIYFGSEEDTPMIWGSNKLNSIDGVVFGYFNTRAYTQIYYYPPAKSESVYIINEKTHYIGSGSIKNNPYIQKLVFGKNFIDINNYRGDTFYNCPKLSEFEFSGAADSAFSSEDGVLYKKGVSYNGKADLTQIYYPPAKSDGYYEFPSGKDYYINGSFYGNPYLQTVKFSGDVYVSEVNGLNCPNLKKVILPKNCTQAIEYLSKYYKVETF